MSQSHEQIPDTDTKSDTYSTHSFTSSSGSETETKPSEIEHSPAQKSTSSTSTSHFVCTFCWQPQYPPAKPKLVGSSRISCTVCWKEVLDLSICWVCGEQIVRGEEVVSLGWCFWHKVCFGCLVCGRALPVPEEAFVDVEQGECDGGEGRSKGKGKKRERGVELESIPLCADCGVELEGKGEDKILEKGLETVGRFDGGLSRSRLMRISEATEKERETDGLSMRWVSALMCGSDDGDRDREKKRSKLAHKFGTDTVPLISDSMSENSVESFPGKEEEIYVSILNPLHEPAFRPSKTKPLPKWMSLLPSNQRQKSDVCPHGRHSHSIALPSKVIGQPILEFPPPTPEPESTPIAEALYPALGSRSDWSSNFSPNPEEEIISTPKPSPAQTKSLERRPAPTSPRIGKSLLEVILPPRPAKEQLESLTKRPPPTFPILPNKNLSLDSKRKNPFARAGSTGTPIYYTPQEKERLGGTEELSRRKTSRPQPKKEITSFPFFQNARQSITPAKDSSWAAGLPSEGLAPFKGTPIESQGSVSRGHSHAHPGPPSSSKREMELNTNAEFLEKYQPITPSAVGKEKYAVGEVGNIIERFEGRKGERVRGRRGEVVRVVEGGIVGESGGGGGDGGDRVKEGLRKELKNLFEGR